MRGNVQQAKVIDLFCGIGGLTHGFVRKGFDVVAGIDNDGGCEYGYNANNQGAKFIKKDIADVSGKDLKKLYGKTRIRILVGCAPCQPFSKLNLNRVTKKQLQPLQKFAQLIEEVQPHVASMENVRGLVKTKIFKEFLTTLDENGYKYSYKIVNFADYGVPQNRKRLVLLASKLGDIALIPPTHKNKKVTVREVIGHLNAIQAGQVDVNDPLHRARKLSELNKLRILATPKNGGNSRSWSKDLMLECHQKETGESYRGSVYGRMSWDKPAPTMTTQCTGLGNGRYGHPVQDRAISLREAAFFQTFGKDYKFVAPDQKLIVKQISRFIGNAVPVRGGEVIAESIRRHLNLVP
ncbi:DNA cytosine methyltransferase [Patescibacteria group bacterium]|nr:DNA cytosine methyltransferase [Patescibacteria group bacterium]